MEDLENSEVMEAYNRLSLLLDKQNCVQEEGETDSPRFETPKRNWNAIESNIEVLTNLIAVEKSNEASNNKEQITKINEPTPHVEGDMDSGTDAPDYHIKENGGSKNENVFPLMDYLVTALFDNNVVSNNTESEKFKAKYFTSPTTNEEFSLNKSKTKPRRFDAFAIFKKAKPGEFNKTLERFLQLEKLRNEKIESIKKELEENEQKEIKPHPQINQESHLLAGQRTKPLHLRTNDILSARKEKIKQLQNQIHNEKELKDPTPNHHPNLEWTSYSSSKKPRKPREFIKDVENWYKKRNEKIQACQIQSLKKDFQKMPFHPKINKKWKNLTNLDEAQPKTVEERLLEVGKQYKEKEKKKQLSSTPTFTPKINKKSLKLADKSRSKSPNPNEFLSVSVERKPRPSFLMNTISYSSKGKEKFVKDSDEKDLKLRNSGHSESFFEKNRKKHKINVVEYNDSNKFVVDALKTKKTAKIMLKIN